MHTLIGVSVSLNGVTYSDIACISVASLSACSPVLEVALASYACTLVVMLVSTHHRIEVIRPALSWSSSGPSFSHLFTVHLPHQFFSFHIIYLHLPHSLLLSSYYCFNLCLMSTFLALSCFAAPSTLLKYLITVTCNLLSCCFCTVQVSHPYSSIGTTIAIKTLIFVLLSSLLSKTPDLITHYISLQGTRTATPPAHLPS